MSITPRQQYLNETDIEAGKEPRFPGRRHKAPESECATCDDERAAKNEFHPSHDASHYCESGKRPHCSCDWCF